MNLPKLPTPVTAPHPKAVIITAFALFLLAGCGEKSGDTPGDISTDPAWDTAEQTTTLSVVDSVRPEFSSPTLSGDTLSSSDLDGKVVLVNFWATWCGPCVIETPELVALYEEWQGRPFEIVGVSMDEEGFEVVSPFAEDFQISYPMIMDYGELADAFGGVYALPTTFVVDAVGKIRHRIIGIFPVEEMREELDELLGQAG